MKSRSYSIEHILDYLMQWGTPNFGFINSLPEKIAQQLKLQAKVNFAETMAKARELCFIYERMEATERVSQLKPAEATWISQMEETLQAISQQLAALTTQWCSSSVSQCFCCGRHDYLGGMITWQGIVDPILHRWNASSVDEEVIWQESVGAKEKPMGCSVLSSQEHPRP